MIRLIAYIIILSCCYLPVQAQLFPSKQIPVIHQNDTLLNAWMGGLDLPQFSGGDFNNDGFQDILIFDKKSAKTIALINDSTGQFIYAPDLDPVFPEMQNFCLFRDYNCDGKLDIFAHANSGIQVYRQDIIGGEISFTLVNTLLKFDLGGFPVNIYNVNGDIPGIEDLDGDGDMDIVVFYNLGTTTPMYRNLSVEMGYGCDSLIFEEFTSCWGAYAESNSNNTVNFDISCKGNTGSTTTNPAGGPKHIGSTILLFDPNEDNKMDILIGDVSFNNMIYLQNDQTSLNAHMDINAVDYTYPSHATTPIDIEIFPAAFYLDVTNDGKKDLIAAPNSFTAHVNTTCSWLYENTGNTSEPFEYVQNDFLVDQCIDNGSFSHPVLFDYNGDSLLDLFVANGYIYENLSTSISKIQLYENVGLDTFPVYEYIEDDYLNLSDLSVDNLRPCFGDIDSDGDDDMLIGDENGLIHYYENTAGAGNPCNFVQNQLQYFNIDVGNKAHPILYDLNEDGLLDIVIGREGSYGEIAFYWNFGTPSNPQFSIDSVNSALGNIRCNSPGFIQGFSAPFIQQTDTNTIIYVGNDVGFIQYYEVNFDSIYGGRFEIMAANLLPSRAGHRTSLSIADVNQDGGLDYFVGNSRGGIQLFSTKATEDSTIISIKENLTSSFDVLLYPNPANNSINLAFGEKLSGQFSLYNALGQIVYSDNIFNKKNYQIDILSLNEGVYLLHLRNDKGQSFVKRFIKKDSY